MFRHLWALFALLICAGATAAAWADTREELPPYTDWHPRLLVDSLELAELPAAIAADEVRQLAWNQILSRVQFLTTQAPEIVLSSNYGLNGFQSLGMASHLAEEPLASAARAKLKETLLHLVDNDDVLGSGDDLSSAIRLRSLLMAYDLGFGEASEAERLAVLVEIHHYLVVMTSDIEFRLGLYNPYCSNHGICIGSALGMADLALRGEWPDSPLLDRARSLGDSLVTKGLTDMHGQDGSFKEGGLYLAWTHRFMIPYWEAIHRLEGGTPWNEDRLQGTLAWTAYQLLPRGQGYFLNRNDCSLGNRPLALHNTLWEWTQRRLPEPGLARWIQDRISGPNGYSWGTFADKLAIVLYHDSGPLQSPHGLLPPQAHFPDQGLYVYREGWPGDPVQESFLFTCMAGTFKGGHWQEDVGHLTLHAFGHAFAADNGPGEIPKDTESHNLPLIDGRGQHNAGAGIGTDGQLELLLDRGWLRALRADMTAAYTTHSPYNRPDFPFEGTDWSWGYDGGNPMLRAERWVLLFPRPQGELPALYVYDDLLKDDDQAYLHEWRWHFENDLGFSGGDGHFQLASAAGRIEARLLAPDPVATSWEHGIYDHGGDDEDTQLLSVFHSERWGRFLWQWLPLYPDQPEPPLTVERYPDGLHASSGEAPGLVRELFCAYGLDLYAPGVLLYGRFAVLESENGETRSALVAGREFRHQGQLLIGLTPAGSALVEGTVVRISDAELSFRIHAPQALEVLAGDEPVPFVRDGDYVLSGTHTGLPETTSPVETGAAPWRLIVSSGSGGQAAVRLALRGPGSPRARLEIFDLRGRRVARLLDGPLAAGEHEFSWERRGRRLAAGIYFARFTAGSQRLSTKFLILH